MGREATLSEAEARHGDVRITSPITPGKPSDDGTQTLDALAKTPGIPREMTFPWGSWPGNRRTPQRRRWGPVSRLHRGFAAVGRRGVSFVAASPSSLAQVAASPPVLLQ